MKKINFFTVFLLNLCILFFGCNFTYEPGSFTTEPTVNFNDNSKDKSIAISIPKKINTAKYINIYRQDVTDDSEESEIENIGILYPKFATTSGSAYIFYDSYITKNHKYKYRIRYADSDEYIFSHWSKEIKAQDGYEEDTVLAYTIPSTAKFNYDNDSFTLKINGTITPPADIENFDTKFKPMIIIKSNDKTQAFPITSTQDGTTIQLRGLLSSDFLDKNITIIGIVPQENIYVKDSADKEKTIIQRTTDTEQTTDSSQEDNSETETDENKENEKIPDIKEIHWLKYTKIKITGKGVSENTITIPSSAQNNGFDYSKKAN